MQPSTSNRLPPHSGLLLVGHGTRDRRGTQEFFQLASTLEEKVAPTPVQGCLLEFQHPTIPEAWNALVDRGVQHVRVCPLLLFAAGHARTDIPEAIAACATTTPSVRFSQSGSLSRAPSIISALSCRVAQAAGDRPAAVDDSVALVMVGRGSYDPCAQADMRVLGEVVARRCGIRQHAVGFYAMADPKLPDVLDQVAGRRGIRSVIVQPHLLFQGRLYDAIGRQVDEASRRHRGVAFTLGGYLGPSNEVADALIRRAVADPTKLKTAVSAAT